MVKRHQDQVCSAEQDTACRLSVSGNISERQHTYTERVWTRSAVLHCFFTLLLLLLDKPCRLPAVAADVDRLLRLMSRRPASLQT